MNLKGYFQQVKKRAGANKLLLGILGALGVMLLVLPGSCQMPAGVDDPPGGYVQSQPDYQTQLQAELERILKTIDGAGRISVFLTLDDEQEMVYAWNHEERERTVFEEDAQGGVREQVEYDERGQLVIVRNGGQEQPVVTQVIRPKVRGVLIVSSNADNPRVRQRLLEAVQGALDTPAYRVTIQKGR